MAEVDSRDFSQKFLFQNRPIRGQFIRLTETYQQILAAQSYPEVIQSFLGEALACTALIHGLFKNTGKISLQFQGTGALKLLSVHGALSYLRGLVQAEETLLSKEDTLLSALKQGQLQLSFDFGENARHQSLLEVVSPHMAQNIEHYFSQSEQTETRIWLAVSPVSVTGFLIQRLPSTEKNASQEEDLWNDAVMRGETLFTEELQTLSPQSLLSRLYPEDDIELFSAESIQFQCPCSKTKMEKALMLMGKAEVLKILEKEAHVDVTCQFCGKSHPFDLIDVEMLFRT